jgi:nicotinate-nucleotide pyrophosphorylase (carboxylating)
MNYDAQLHQLIANALAEDIGPGDYSTLSTIDPDQKGKADLKVKQDGVLAGMDVAEIIFRQVEPGCTFKPFKMDGDQMKYGDQAFEVEAGIHTILKCERLVLNTMQRMSGIATLTQEYVLKLAPYRTRLLDTRKTTPNFRLLEKEAVRIGGGVNHRMGLYDMIMLKDNHIDYCGSIENAINKAAEYVKSHGLNLKIEVETRSIDDVKRVMQTGKVDWLMLDNFSPETIAEAL